MKSLIYLCVFTLLLVGQVSAQISEADAIKQLAEIDKRIAVLMEGHAGLLTRELHHETCKVESVITETVALVRPVKTADIYLLKHSLKDLKKDAERPIEFMLTDETRNPWKFGDEQYQVGFTLTTEAQKIRTEYNDLQRSGFDLVAELALSEHGKPFSLYVNYNGKAKKSHKYKVKNVMPKRNPRTGEIVAFVEDSKGKRFQAPGNLAERSQKMIDPFTKKIKAAHDKYLSNTRAEGN